MKSNLACLGEGSGAVVGDIRALGELRGRLMDLGFTPGAGVRCLFAAPSGDPRAYMVRGSVIALRRADAALVGLCARGA